jgi:hypothetical protein
MTFEVHSSEISVLSSRHSRQCSAFKAYFFCIVIMLLVLFSCIQCYAQLGEPAVTTGKQKVYDSLARQLAVIGYDDEKYRNQLEFVAAQYGGVSPEMKELLKKMQQADSINFIKVSNIVDTHGWLGSDAIGSEGNVTLFMVVQHATLEGQEKYLPVLREAVKKGRAKPGNLALLEDRVALKKGGKQIYGSQISWNMKTNEYYVMPLEDPDNVDKRRASVGLAPLAQYVMGCCNLVWDVERYKKEMLIRESEITK